MTDAAFVCARFAHYAGLTFLLGAAWAPAYAELTELRRPLRRAVIAAAVLALASACVWFACVAAEMTGAPLWRLDAETGSALIGTDFARLWAARGLTLIALLLVCVGRRPRPRAELLLAAGATASLALTGHAQAQDGWIGRLHVGADALHLLAAGVWVGGLAILLLLSRSDRTGPAAAQALRRFGGTGYACTAVLALTGAVSAALLVRAPAALVTTAYGRLLLVKLALFVLMLALAARNRREARRPRTDAAAMTRRIVVEQGAGLGVLVLVAVLGNLSPQG